MASSSNKIDISNSKNKNKESEVEVLSIIDKSYFNRNTPEENFEIPSKLLSSLEESNNSQNNNITLFNVLYNSLINKDHKSFLFCIQQSNMTLIEDTVKQMNSDCLGKFLEKSVDIFQSNSFYAKMIIPWFQNILRYKKLETFRKKNIENLKKIQIYIKDKIKCFDALCILKTKINKINQIFCENKKDKKNFEIKKDESNEQNDNDKPIIFKPLLTYYESEDEDETKLKDMKKNKMEIEGFEEIEKDEEENEDNINIIGDENEKEESEEDDLDEEIDNMLLDENEEIRKKKLEKNKKKEKEDDKDDIENENEENEDDIEEED